ncbi:MAG TPA: hypothetical protein VIR34_13430 [Gemmatimonadaceae bacterium]|jgi:hypothetical protein
MADRGSTPGVPAPQQSPSQPAEGSNAVTPARGAIQGRLSRDALERVLSRAAELQAGDADPADAMLTEEQLVEVGREVGLSPQHVRQALAEERSRVLIPEEQGGMARVFGTARVHASRTVRGTTDSIFRALDMWMQREESMQVKRRLADRMTWEPRSGFITEVRRGLNLGGFGYHLSRAEEVAATVVPVDRERVLVRLEADLANVRLQRVASGGALFGGGAIGTAVLLALGFFAPIAIIPVGVAAVGGYFVSRSHAPLVARAQTSLEQLLDRLERGEDAGIRQQIAGGKEQLLSRGLDFFLKGPS